MIAVIDSQLGNTNSVLFALDRLGARYKLTAAKTEINRADQVILPGVGHAAAGMRKLKELDLVDTIRNLSQPTLGICLGMQILFDFSEEGGVDCLGLIPGKVTALAYDPRHPVPHMGWNQIKWESPHCSPSVELNEAYFYFVHSYAVDKSEYTVASCEYGREFSAIVKNRNFTGIQFHPEKSGSQGEELLRHYLEL